ncbi:MAG: exodeoxyribonuclease V subunit gamma [Deltaproteobacteria bacterium]|nr:MAG: exodeoxyribonuclease V subunit gamma [Deltaproteobacteria bacterium]
MLYLHVSNRTENLLRHMAAVIRADRQPEVFAPELILIQSQGMERMIAQTLADEFGCFCNYSFFLPINFFQWVAERLGLGVKSNGFDRQTLGFRIDHLLREREARDYPPLDRYIDGRQKDLKRFQLARRLANIFDQYQVMRPSMLAQWAKGKRCTSNQAEAWQLFLWQQLLAQPGGSMHRGELFQAMIELLTEDGSQPRLPRRLAVFGLHTVPPLFLECLNALSRHMDVHFYLLSPCRKYWGDIQTKRQIVRAQLVSEKRDGDCLEESSHPLLASLGRQGRELQRLMLEMADFALEFASYEDPGRETLLHRVQSDLLEGSVGERPLSPCRPDGSLHVVSCHSRLRELYVLRENILSFLYCDDNLELRDIVVMAPDIQEYAPFIPAIFENIQHSIADRSTRRRNSLFSAFLSFLQLFSGRFGWSEVFDLLRQPSVFARFGLVAADLETLEVWIKEAGIRWGLSAEQRREIGIEPFSAATWQEGLERMFMGFATAADTFVDGVLPYDAIEGSEAGALGGLFQFVSLLDEARRRFCSAYTLGQWSEILLEMMERLFVDNGERDYAELRLLISDFAGSAEGFSDNCYRFEVVCEWFRDAAQERRTSSGFLRGQLTFCSMLPMRSIPFKILCLLGLNDGVYPRPDSTEHFDLLNEPDLYQPGDRSPRADDRYQFLEAILAARQKLYISYVGQSAETNEKIQPSVVVCELLDMLENHYLVKTDDIVVHHPIHTFSGRYFETSENNPLQSYDAEACEVARQLRAGPEPPAPWWQGRLEYRGGDVQVEQLLQFFNNPQRYFLVNCLGVRLRQPQSGPEDGEMFDCDALASYQINQEMIDHILSGREVGDSWLKKAQAEGRWPVGASGRVAFLRKKQEIRAFVEILHKQEMGEMADGLEVELQVDGQRLCGQLANIYEKGAMLFRYGKIRGRDLVCCWLHHLIASLVRKETLCSCLVTPKTILRFTGKDTGPDLQTLLQIFTAGQMAPSPLYLEPAYAYANAALKGGRKDPLGAAEKALSEGLDKGYYPETALILRPLSSDFQLDKAFEKMAEEVVQRILEAADAS